MKPYIWIAVLPALALSGATAQTRVITPRTLAFSNDDSHSARIGVYLGDNGIRDTLGVLVSSVIDGSPADKAGIKDGDRIQSVDGVNLKMTRDDAEDQSLEGTMNRRLTRELDKLKPGDEVELRVLSGGAAKTVRVKTVAASELSSSSEHLMPAMRTNFDERASLGLGMGGAMSKRDTIGVFVMSVTPDGPAEKAGIIEGDRIARINGIDLRVPASDAGDRDLSAARMRRFTQEMDKVKPGDAVALTVVTAGRSRDVKLNAAKSSDLHGDDDMDIIFGGGFGRGTMPLPRVLMPGTMTLPRRGSSFKLPDAGNLPNGAFLYRNGTPNDVSEDVRQTIERAMEKARKAIEDARQKEDRLRIPVVRRSVIRGPAA